METMEFEGKTTEEAIENASKFLDLPVEDLNIDILEPGSAGIFGLVGMKKAKIKVSYVPSGEISEEDEELREFGSLPDTVDEDTEDEPEDEEAVEDEEEMEAEPYYAPSPAAELTPEQGEELRLAKEVLETILSLIPMNAEVTVQRAEGNVNLNIKGDNSGLLIGRRGKTLDALQFIVNKVVNKSLERKVRVVIDSERYRQRRRESLTQLALRMGEKAKRIRKPVTTNPMNPGDRRIVHLALKDDTGLDTRSRGEGLMKKVVIIPRK